MSKRKSSKTAEPTPAKEGLWDDWKPPTRAPYLENNPFAHLTEDEARTRLRELYPQLRAIQHEIEHLERIALSFNIVYMGPDGIVRKAV